MALTRDAITIRRANANDAAELARLRVALAVSSNDAGLADAAAREEYRSRCLGYFKIALHAENLFVWVGEFEREVVGSAAMLVHESLPRVQSRDSVFGVPLDARLRSVYVEARARRLGLARALVVEAIACARDLGCFRITLGSSAMGAPLYDSLGFVELEREMSLRL